MQVLIFLIVKTLLSSYVRTKASWESRTFLSKDVCRVSGQQDKGYGFEDKRKRLLISNHPTMYLVKCLIFLFHFNSEFFLSLN